MSGRIALVLAVSLLSAQCVLGQSAGLVQKRGPATLEVSAKLKDGHMELSLSDTLEATWTVAGEKSVHVELPTKLTRSAGWEVLRAEAPKISAKESGGQTWQMKFVLVPALTGEQLLQLEPLRFRIDEGKLETVSWDAIPARISSVVANADLKSLRDPTSIEELPPLESDSRVLWWVLGGGLAGAAVCAALFVLRKRRVVRAAAPAAQVALRELERIAAMSLPEKGHVKQFQAMLGEVVRRYLEKTLHIPARRQTTAEFLQSAKESATILPEDQEFLRLFLERCDLAKFAAAPVSPEECRSSIDEVRAWIQESKPAGRAG
ncbi:MAG: hypothetical protein HY040_14960 [Planctomycetes bacterium]|nr:hypothetical protein [Planctomycetota bacterium]